MKIKYLAHASFLITSGDNKRIITDPYKTGHGLNYGDINETADIVTISHEHGDHNNAGAIKGNPMVLKQVGHSNIKDIDIKGIPAYHDEVKGSKRGNNLIFCFNIDGMDVCHLGDLGHPLDRQQLLEIGHVDVLMIPVGGFFTINAEEAFSVAQSLGATAIIPMHFKTAKAELPINTADEFLKNKKNVRRPGSSEVEFKRETLPEQAEIIFLQPALV